MIQSDPPRGWQLEDGGRQSPGTNLFHELHHIFSEEYDEERCVKSENSLAAGWGEASTRKNHADGFSFFNRGGVNSIIPAPK